MAVLGSFKENVISALSVELTWIRGSVDPWIRDGKVCCVGMSECLSKK